MVQPVNKHLDGGNLAELRRFKGQQLDITTVPGADINAGMFPIFDPVRKKYYGSIDGTTLTPLMTLEDMVDGRPFRGIWNATSGIPTAAGSSVRAGEAITAGDYWRVSVAGTIAGMAGLDDLEIGDLIYANVDNPATAADFWAMQGNVSPGGSGTLKSSTVTLPTLAASTATDVLPSGVDGISSIKSVVVLDGLQDVTNGYDIAIDNSAPKATLTSLIAKSNLSITFIGE